MGGEPPGKAQAMAPAPGEGGGAGGKGPGAPPSAEGEGPTGAEAKPKAKPGGEAATGAAGPKAGTAPRMSRPSVRMTPRGGGAQGSPRPAPAAGELDLREVRPVLNPRFSHMSLDRGGRFARWVAAGAAAAGGAGARRGGGLVTPTGAGGDLRGARHCAHGQDGVVLVCGGGRVCLRGTLEAAVVPLGGAVTLAISAQWVPMSWIRKSGAPILLGMRTRGGTRTHLFRDPRPPMDIAVTCPPASPPPTFLGCLAGLL